MSFRFNQGDRPLAGYTIQRGVGRGGFGEVYYALSDGGKEVALKYLRDNPQVELRGAQHCLNLKSPYLVSIQDIKQSPGGEFFVVMEYVNGASLRDLMNEEPRGLGVEKAAYFLREIGKGLTYLHDRGIVHRDLKPGNIFYEDGYVKIGDYGLSKLMASSQHSGQTMSVGTVHYMAPEVGSGNYDRTIDIYALGVVLYEMLLGRVPFSGSSMGEVLMKHLTAAPEVDELPEPFPRVIRKALAKDPRDRYQTVPEMMADVFATEALSQSVASVDSLNLTRMAAAVGKKVKIGAGAGAQAGGFGSSNVSPMGATLSAAPPLVIERDRKPPRPPAGSAHAKKDEGFWEAMEQPFKPAAEADFPRRSRLTTGLLGVFLGWLGAHRFYTGHYGIGIYQILASIFTGIGVLWGIIEGIVILMNGDFRDAHGRPLIDRSMGDPSYRNVMVRVFWALVGVATFIGSVVFALVGTFADPEFEQVSGFGSGTYFVNVMHIFYLGAVAALCLSGYSIWKASHRGGFSFWRATLRPALMAVCALLSVDAIIGVIFLAPKNIQPPLMGLSVLAGIAFMTIWLLRGSRENFFASDFYWNRALLGIFVLGGLGAGALAGGVGYAWGKDRFPFEIKPWNVMTHQASGRDVELWRWTSGDDSLLRRGDVVRTSQVYYDLRSVGAVLLGLLAIGALLEADYRRRAARKAMNVLHSSQHA